MTVNDQLTAFAPAEPIEEPGCRACRDGLGFVVTVVPASSAVPDHGDDKAPAASGAAPVAEMTAEARFWSKVDKSGKCWIWTAGTNSLGYGKVKIAGRNLRAHRVAWTLTNGPIPAALFLCHSCDNPPCVRPAHMFVGTHTDNMRDAQAKGRLAVGDLNGSRKHPESRPRGTRHHSARLTENDVREIRSKLAGGIRPTTLARRFGVGFKAIKAVGTGNTWGWLPTSSPAPDKAQPRRPVATEAVPGARSEPARGAGRRSLARART